jgi:putative PIG3 family NAD(P)H quinone oxidoreductase
MQAILISRNGGPEVLTPGVVPEPVAGPNDVVIAITAAGVNRADIGQRQGTYPPPPGSPEWPGMEVSGVVESLGDAVPATSGLAVGAEVVALLGGGGYAEKVAVDAGLVLPKPVGPDGPTLLDAAGLPEAAATVWSNVFMLGALQPGETLLVHGGTSGIGTMAIKLGRLFGLTVVVTCGSDAKCAAARQIGAAHAINYRADDFVDAVKAVTDERGVEIVLDLVGGDYVARNLRCLAAEGRHVSIAVQGGRLATIDLATVMQRRLVLTGSTLRPRSAAFKALVAGEIARTVWPHVAAGELKPEIDRVLPLSRAADAHSLMEEGGHVGKIVLVPDQLFKITS